MHPDPHISGSSPATSEAPYLCPDPQSSLVPAYSLSGCYLVPAPVEFSISGLLQLRSLIVTFFMGLLTSAEVPRLDLVPYRSLAPVYFLGGPRLTTRHTEFCGFCLLPQRSQTYAFFSTSLKEVFICSLRDSMIFSMKFLWLLSSASSRSGCSGPTIVEPLVSGSSLLLFILLNIFLHCNLPITSSNWYSLELFFRGLPLPSVDSWVIWLRWLFFLQVQLVPVALVGDCTFR